LLRKRRTRIMNAQSGFNDVIALATAASAQAQMARSAKALTAAIIAWQRVLDQPGIDKFADLVWGAELELGNSYLDRFDAFHDLQDLDHAIGCYETVLATSGPNLSYRAGLQVSLGGARQQRYNLLEQPDDLEASILAYRQALAGSDVTGIRRERLLNNYGLALYNRYFYSNAMADLELAIDQFQQLETGEDAQNSALARSNLGIALRARSKLTQNPDDLDASIAAQHQALHAVQPGSFNWGKWQNNLGNALENRFALLGHAQDLEEALLAYRRALVALPDTAREWVSTQLNLGSALACRYNRFGDEADLGAAISALEWASAHARVGSMIWCRSLSNLANALRWRFFALGSQEDLEAAVEIADQVLEATTPGSSTWVTAQLGVGVARRARFGTLGQLPDLERSLSAHEKALAVVPSGSDMWANGQFGKGEALLTAYKYAGHFADLEAAIESLRKALAAFPVGSGNYADVAASLGEALDLRYQGLEQLADVEESIALHQQALIAVHPGSPKWIRWQAGLGVALSLRYQELRRDQDLEAAITVLRSALAVPQPHSGSWVIAQIELAGILTQRNRMTRRLEDLDEVIAVTDEALKAIRPGESEWLWCQQIRADAFRFRFGALGEVQDLEIGTRIYQQILDSADAMHWLNHVFGAASGLAELYAVDGNWDAAAIACCQAVAVSTRLYAAQFYLTGREARLRRMGDFHTRAAYILARAGRLEDAVVMLETGRARVLSEALARDRADIDRVKDLAPDTYKLYVDTADQLRHLEAAERAGDSSMGLSGEAHLMGETLRNRVNETRHELETAIRQIRALPGYEGFLTEPGWDDIAAALDEKVTVIYLVASMAGGLAILVQRPYLESGTTTATVEALWLDDFTAVRVRNLLTGSGAERSDVSWVEAYASWRQNPGDEIRQQAWFAAIDATTRSLWDLLMGRIVEVLRSRSCSEAVLIPTGLLELLPFHAAWTANPATLTGRSYALDTITFTYTPNIRSRKAAQAIAGRTRPTSFLAIADPQPTQAHPLPNAEREAQAASSYFLQSLVLAQEEATRDAVLTELSHYTVVHFSCHGSASFASPLDSGLLLANNEFIRLQDFLHLPLHGLRLAILSACETNLPGLDLLDEVISLPSGLMQAGAAGVAASLWSVEDFSTMLLLVRFYDGWRTEGLEPAVALRQAQLWLRDTTSQEKAVYFKDTQPDLFDALIFCEPQRFAHPFYWAAFTYVGV
jgi:CHAT domain-containing protein/tetratricopeptide (TPR) repeat protein